MDRLTPFLKRFGIAMIAGVVVLVAFLLFGVDQRCSIEIRNASQSPMVLKTYQYNKNNKKIIVDSVSLGHDDTFEIGSCAVCTPPDTMDFAFDAVALYDSAMTLRFMRREDFLKYLESNEKRECVTYVVR